MIAAGSTTASELSDSDEFDPRSHRRYWWVLRSREGVGMPQITVQYPEALAAGFDRRGFALAAHAAASDLISSALGGFKTRFLALDETVVGDGSPHHHMVHAIVDILPGRPEELKERLGKLILGLLEEHLTIPSAYSVQVTTEIRELKGYHQLVLL